jgi:hypothetical protein
MRAHLLVLSFEISEILAEFRVIEDSIRLVDILHGGVQTSLKDDESQGEQVISEGVGLGALDILHKLAPKFRGYEEFVLIPEVLLLDFFRGRQLD